MELSGSIDRTFWVSIRKGVNAIKSPKIITSSAGDPGSDKYSNHEKKWIIEVKEKREKGSGGFISITHLKREEK